MRGRATENISYFIMPASIYRECVTELFSIEETSAQYIYQDGSHKILVRCSANVLRPNNAGTITTSCG